MQFEYENRPQPSSHRPPPQPRGQAQQPRREYRPEPQQQRAQPIVLVQQVDPIDPFESTTFDNTPRAAQRVQSPPRRVSTPHQEPMGYSVSTEAGSHNGDEGSQSFPGSDLF